MVLGHINEFVVHRDRYVHGMDNSLRVRESFISLLNRPSRPTQNVQSDYQLMSGDTLRLGSNSRCSCLWQVNCVKPCKTRVISERFGDTLVQIRISFEYISVELN